MKNPVVKALVATIIFVIISPLFAIFVFEQSYDASHWLMSTIIFFDVMVCFNWLMQKKIS